MARLAPGSPLKHVSGQIGKQLVLKQYGDKTIVSRYPDMSGIKPSAKQKSNRKLFKAAVAYAQNINRNPTLKKQYLEKITAGDTVYRFALKEYLAQHKL